MCPSSCVFVYSAEQKSAQNSMQREEKNRIERRTLFFFMKSRKAEEKVKLGSEKRKYTAQRNKTHIHSIKHVRIFNSYVHTNTIQTQTTTKYYSSCVQ